MSYTVAREGRYPAHSAPAVANGQSGLMLGGDPRGAYGNFVPTEANAE